MMICCLNFFCFRVSRYDCSCASVWMDILVRNVRIIYFYLVICVVFCRSWSVS